MTTAHHSPLTYGGPLTSAAMEAPLGQLDAAIALAVSSGSGWSTLLDGGAAAGQKVVPVASTTGAEAGQVLWLRSASGATSESAVIASVQAGVSVTTVANLVGTYVAGALASASPAELVDARGGFPSLGGRLNVLDRWAYDVRRYGAVGDGTTDDTAAIQAAITAAIAGNGRVFLSGSAFRITAPLDFSTAKATNKAVGMFGLGAGDNATGFAAATLILNDHTGPAIKAYGTLAGATSQSISGLHLSDFAVQLQQNIGGANYAIDLDYTGSGVALADLYIFGQNLTGNGIQWRNMFHGQSTIDRVTCRGFRTGIGFRFAAEASANVDVAPNSGNITLNACSAFDVLRGYDVSGTNTFNSGVLLNCKAVNISDVPNSVGFKLTSGVRAWSIISPHSERFSTGILLDSAEHCVIAAPHVSFPTGTPDAASAGIKMSGVATGNIATGAMLSQTHYGVVYAGDARTNSVHGSDRTGIRVLTAWSLDTSSGGTNHVLKTEGESPFLWTMPKTMLSVGKIGLTNVTSPAQLTAATENWSVGGNTYGVVRIAASAAWNLGGIVAGNAGDRMTLCNISAYTVTLVHGSGGSVAANQFLCPAAANVALRASGSVDVWYDGTSSRWRVVAP